MDIVEMKPIGQSKKAGTNGQLARGAALAVVCMAYATKRMEMEEKEAGKLKAIVKSIAELTHEGHVEFRAELQKELSLLKELRKTAGVTREQTQGYSFNSFETLVSNWRGISAACELGYKPEDKPWAVVVAESVQLRQAHAANAAEGSQLPIKRKAGRKATPLIDKAIKAAEELLENNPASFLEFAAWMQTTVKAMKN